MASQPSKCIAEEDLDTIVLFVDGQYVLKPVSVEVVGNDIDESIARSRIDGRTRRFEIGGVHDIEMAVMVQIREMQLGYGGAE